LGLVFLGGLAASLSACVYPLIPIITAIFGAAQIKSWHKSLFLSVIYVTGMSITYMALGIAASLGGSVFGSYMGNKWFIIAFGCIFFFLGLWFMGILPIKLPNFADKLQVKKNNKILYPLIMGIFSGFIAAPCTAPLFGAVLADIAVKAAENQSIIPGTMMALAFSLGMGMPFILIGGFAVRLPKPGRWMQAVKYFGAAILFTAGFHYFQDLGFDFPPAKAEISLAITGFFIFIVFFILAEPLVDPEMDKTVKKSHVLTFLLIAAFGLFMATSPLASRSSGEIEKSPLSWKTSLEDGLNSAEDKNSILLIDFWAEWCVACHEMDKKLFASDEFIELANKTNVVLVRLDFTDESDNNLNLAQKYDIKGLPTVVITNSKGEKLEDLIGFHSKELSLSELIKFFEKHAGKK